jgi:PAS domain S-box-containing protein
MRASSEIGLRDGQARLGAAPSRRSLVLLAVLTGLYFAAGKLGLGLASLHQSASPVWPATGIALAAVLLYGARVWPAIFIGALLVNLTTVGTVFTSLGIATGNTLEALLGAWLVERFARGTRAFDRAGDVLRFALCAGLIAAAVSATFGVSSLAIGGFADWERFFPIWLTWWLGDVVSALVVTPLLVVWVSAAAPDWRDAARLAETVMALAVVLLVGGIVFGDLVPAPYDGYPTAFLCFPPLLWPVFRLGRRGTVAALFTLAATALVGTLRGHGPFALLDLNDSLLMLQAFVATITVMNLVLASLVGERKRVVDELGRSQRTLGTQLVEIEDLYRTVRRSERELNDLFENASQGIDWVSTDGVILRANRAGLRMLGYEESEYVGRNLADFHASPEVARIILRRVERGERLEEFPAQLRCRDGSLRDVVIDSSLYADNGLPLHAQLFVRDVTERRKAEAELALSQQELETRVVERTAELARAQRRLQGEAEARKRLEAEVAAAVESEQLRLGQELHEGLGQELTGIAYLMAALHRALQGASSKQALEAMRLEDLITRSIERTRSLAKAFYPVEMETLGLLASLEEIAYNAMESFGIRCLVRAEDPECADLRGPLAIQLFRIAQEAVLNAVKHGHAGLIEISIAIDGGDLVLKVADDGVGLPGDLAEVEGTGLRIMRYRAGIVGGVLEVRSRPSGGSMVLCSAPLPAG